MHNDYAHLADAKRLLKRDERKVLTVVESVIYDRKVGSLPILDCLKTGNMALTVSLVSNESFFLSLLANPAPSRRTKKDRRV